MRQFCVNVTFESWCLFCTICIYIAAIVGSEPTDADSGEPFALLLSPRIVCSSKVPLERWWCWSSLCRISLPGEVWELSPCCWLCRCRFCSCRMTKWYAGLVPTRIMKNKIPATIPPLRTVGFFTSIKNKIQNTMAAATNNIPESVASQLVMIQILRDCRQFRSVCCKSNWARRCLACCRTDWKENHTYRAAFVHRLDIDVPLLPNGLFPSLLLTVPLSAKEATLSVAEKSRLYRFRFASNMSSSSSSSRSNELE